MKIKLLSQNLINQIAAGEVIERPSSVIKELMENAIDAGATEIEVKIINAGKNFISIADNGCGMDKESLKLCVLNHATSKLELENLFDIHTFGFRGEALPSIASISRLKITSAIDSSSEAWSIQMEGSKDLELSMTTRKQGTTVEVRDLFFATPARLKFLKSDSSETDGCYGVFNQIALAFNDISFKLIDSSKEKFFYKKTTDLQKRVEDVLGSSFMENTFAIDAQGNGLRLHGFIGVPTFNKASAGHQYFFINKRLVKDKIFAYALKAAYAGLMPPGRHAAAVLYLEIPFDEVDVNAHPSKIEVRFKESEKVRHFIISELKKKLLSFGASRPATTVLNDFARNRSSASLAQPINSNRNVHYSSKIPQNMTFGSNVLKKISEEKDLEADRFSIQQVETPKEKQNRNDSGIFLGDALCQIDNTYVIASCGDELIIVDQHAAAERITLEKLKNNISLDSQTLLLPEVCSLTVAQIELLENNKELLLKFGIHYEKLASDLVIINAVPAILETCDAKSLIMDILDELAMFNDTYSMDEKIHRVLSTASCHGSLRAGEKLTIYEMNALLRQMENSKNIAQCCHGRPSYIRLSTKNLNIFFERS